MVLSAPPHDKSLSSARQEFAGAEYVLPVIGPIDAISDRLDVFLTIGAHAAKTGSLAARNALFLALQPKLLHQARQIRPWMLPASWDKCDLEQEAFVVFAQLVDAWSGEGSFTGYILGHFGWRLRNVVRHARDRERLPVARLETATLAEDDSWAAEELRVLLEEIAANFPPIEQEILLGRVRDGDGFGALAHRLGLSRKTVYRHWILVVIELRRSFGLPVELPAGWLPATWKRRPNHRSDPRDHAVPRPIRPGC
jgi:RNA polymerase sigma factor (sigma-70 family)